MNNLSVTSTYRPTFIKSILYNYVLTSVNIYLSSFGIVLFSPYINNATNRICTKPRHQVTYWI